MFDNAKAVLEGTCALHIEQIRVEKRLVASCKHGGFETDSGYAGLDAFDHPVIGRPATKYEGWVVEWLTIDDGVGGSDHREQHNRVVRRDCQIDDAWKRPQQVDLTMRQHQCRLHRRYSSRPGRDDSNE